MKTSASHGSKKAEIALVCKDIGKGMIRKIISDAELTRDEWLELIESL